MKTRALIYVLMAGLCGSALLGCGGGSSGDGAAITSVGTITGFGSVIVNGVRFDDRNAVIAIDDEVAASSQLKIGMVVAIEGRLRDCSSADSAICTGTATRIRFRNNLVGPITAINRLTNTVQVMNREIVVDDTTVFGGANAPDLSGFTVGDTVSVSGHAEQNRVRARLLQRIGPFVNGTTPIKAYGLVANVNSALGTCTVDGLQVRFLGLSASDLPADGVVSGQYVSVLGREFVDGSMNVDRIQLRDRISYPDASLIELEGYVSEFVSVANFMIDGQKVDASDAIFRNGTSDDLGDAVKVEVEGVIASGVLIARKVIFRLEANSQIVAPIQSKESSTESLAMLGQRVSVTPLTQYMDFSTVGVGRPVRTLGYADLTVNDRVDVHAYKNADGDLVAIRVNRTEADPLLVAKGAVDTKSPVTQLRLLGIDVTTGVATRYRDAMGDLVTDVDFYGSVQVPPAAPSIVRAQGVASTLGVNTIDATRTTSTSGEVEIVH